MSDHREAIGDPDDDGGDFAEEHEQTEVTPSDEGESESPDRYAGGLDDDGPV